MTSIADRMGMVDRLALALFKEVADLVENESWDETFETAVIVTTEVDPDDMSEEAMDTFWDEVETLRDKVLARMAKAFLAHLDLDRSDKIVGEYYRIKSEEPQQT